MKINLKLNEMFALSRIVEKQEIIGYKAALTKLYHQMLDVEPFSELISIFEEIQINNNKIQEEHKEQKEEIINELVKYKNNSNDIPVELNNKMNNFNRIISSESSKVNDQLIKKADSILNNNNEYEFDFNTLTIKSIKNFVESEQDYKSLQIDQVIAQSLISVYLKIE